MIFSTTLLSWYEKHKRDLPWRNTTDPYRILVSEIMLQQTQVRRVILKYQEFLNTFPTVNDLARASKAEVIQAWSGLGYNRRALLLHQFAKVIIASYQGIIPTTVAELRQLPGIGPYAAGAIASFAFNQPAPAIDVNVRRIYRRYFEGVDIGLPQSREKERELYQKVQEIIPLGKSRDFHNALMDFGSMVCTRVKPHCDSCPLQVSCRFFPLYTTQKENVLYVMEKAPEQGVVEEGKFVPNRIFRGRIVEWVRKNSGTDLLLHELGKIIKADYTEEDHLWLLALCSKLQADGLLRYTSKNSLIRLELAKD